MKIHLMLLSILFSLTLAWAEMKAVKDCTLEISGNQKTICITGKAPRLCEYDLKMPTSDYKSLRLVYTATNLPARFTATIFFLPQGVKNFTGEYRLPLYNLISDGKQHTAEVPLPAIWYKHPLTTALRFDPVNNTTGGQFIVHEMTWVKAPNSNRWCKANDFAGWGTPMRATASKQNGLLVFNIQGKNSRIYNNNVRVNTQNTSALVIRYRAKGLPTPCNGNFFFCHIGDKNFVAEKRAGLHGMIADGQWHEIKAQLPPIWKSAPVVSSLRIDLADQASSGSIEIESIQFISGSERTENLNPVPVWRNVKPELPTAEKTTLPTPYWKARMIYSPEDKGERIIPYAMRRTFTAPSDISRALLQLTADDCFAVWLNGKLVADHLSEHIWWEPVAIDVKSFLLPGKENLLCVKYVNFSGPGGVLLQLDMVAANGQVTTVCSDQDFTATQCPSSDNWLKANFQPVGWQKVLMGGTPPTPPWRKTLAFQDATNTIPARLLDIRQPDFAKAGSPCTMTLQVHTDKPIPEQRLSVKLCTLPNRISLPEKYVPLPPCKAGTTSFSFSLPIPRCFSDCVLTYSIESDRLCFDKKIQGTIVYKSTPLPDKNIPFQVRKTANGARLFADGKPMHMLCGNVHVTDSRYSSKLEQVPVNFRTCHLKMNAPHKVWIRSLNGEYDFSVIDRCAETRLEIDPNVYLIFSMELGLPHKFAKDFTGDIVRREDGSTFKGSVISVQPGSALNKKVITEALVALVKYCEKAPYANRIAGFLLADGETMEWQYFGSSRAALNNSLIDYSPGAKANYRKLTGANVPPTKERLAPKCGLFYDVQSQSHLIRANEYLSEVMAGNIIDYCRAMKQAMTIQKLCGVYYGYHLEYGNCGWKRQIAGHNRLREVLNSGVVDFLVSPPSYTSRNIGNSGADMKPFASITQAGVLPIIDDDTRTHTIIFQGQFHTLTANQTNSIIRRNLGQYLCRQECVWMLPLCEGREFDAPQTLQDLAVFKKAAAYQIKQKVNRQCDIAVVVDERSYDLLAPDSRIDRHEPYQRYEANGKVIQDIRRCDRLFGELVSIQRERLAKLGAPVDYLLSSDVSKNIGRYKLWIFLDTLQYDKAFLKAIRTLQSQPVTIVWCYAPGFVHGKNMNTQNMEQLTGIKFTRLPEAGSLEMEMSRKNAPTLLMGYPEKIAPRFAVADKDATIHGYYYDCNAVAISQKTVGRSNTWFFGGNCIDSSIWRILAQNAGVHIYSDSNDTLFANDAFIAIHAERPGKKTIRLPQKAQAVWDIFSRKKIAEATQEFSFVSTLHESRIFFLGDLPSAF